MPGQPQKKTTTKFYILLAFICFCWLSGKIFNFSEEQFRSFVAQYPPEYTIAIFLFLYVVLTFFVWLSKDVLMVAGGYLFGLYGSTVLICIAEAVNAVVLFGLSRKMGRDFVAKKMSGKYHNLDQRLGNANLFDIFALRAVILIPFRFLDLGFGLTKISLRKYMAGVIMGSPFRVLVRQYFIIIVLKFVMDAVKRQDFQAVADYVQTNDTLGTFSLIYVFAWVILFWRLKKLLFG